MPLQAAEHHAEMMQGNRGVPAPDVGIDTDTDTKTTPLLPGANAAIIARTRSSQVPQPPPPVAARQVNPQFTHLLRLPTRTGAASGIYPTRGHPRQGKSQLLPLCPHTTPFPEENSILG